MTGTPERLIVSLLSGEADIYAHCELFRVKPSSARALSRIEALWNIGPRAADSVWLCP